MRLASKIGAGALPFFLALSLAGCGGATHTASNSGSSTKTSNSGSSSSSSSSSTSSSGSSSSSSGSSSAVGPVKGGTLTIAFSQEPDTLDVAKTGLTAVAQIMRNVVDTLVWLAPNGKPEPDLATSWTVSKDGKTYTFKLRQGVKFTDGTPFNAKAVVANFNYIMNPKTHSISAKGALGPFVSATATGPYTVVVKMSKPYSWFLANLGEPTLGMQSPTAIKKYGSQYGLHPVGTGPFMVKQFVPNSKVVLVRNPNYNWAPQGVKNHGAPYLNSVVYDIVQSGQSRVDELQSGQAQLVDGTPPLSYKTLKTQTSKYASLPMPIPGAGEYAIINNSKFPTNSLAVRKAILYSIDRKGLVQLADQGVYPLIWGPLQPGTIGYTPEFKQQKMYNYNPQKAASILQAAGWKKVNGIWTKGGKQLKIVITHINVLDLALLAQGIQSYLQKAGMVVTIQSYADSAWHAANVKGVENITPLEFSNLNPDLLRIEFTPGQYFNWSKYSNPKVTKLVEDALSVTNFSQRLAMYKKAQEILMQDAAMLPEHENDDLMIMDSNVKGIQVYPGGDPYYYSTYLAK